MARRGHDDLMTLRRCSDPALYATPAHHGGIRRKASLENFVPADQRASACIEETFDPPDEVTLQPMFVGKVFSSNPCLAFLACFPSILRNFIAADMNIP